MWVNDLYKLFVSNENISVFMSALSGGLFDGVFSENGGILAPDEEFQGDIDECFETLSEYIFSKSQT